METHEGNSAPTVTKFHIESTWAPATPIKPPVTRPGPIYDHKGVDYLPPTYLREYSLQNQPQSLVSYSISSAEITSSNPNGINNYWDAQNKSSPSIGPTILGRENVGLQRRGLEDHLPHWSTHGPRSFGSASSGFSSRDMPVLKSGERENGGVVDSVYDESLAQFNNMSFGDLLAMKDSVMDSSMGGTRLGNNNGGVTTSALYPTLDPESQADGRGMETFCGHNLLSNGIRGGEMHNGAFCDQNGSLSNVNSPLGTKHANQKITAFAPLTPHLRCKAESNVASANINDEVNQSPNEQNRLSEDEDEAAMVNLQDVDNREAMGGGHPTPGKVPALVDENLNSEKVGEHGIDLNKMPQKKPRRKRYLPKVVNENKPKRTPKPSTPKPPDSKETPKPKRKYVRKNKMNPFSTATPAEGAAEVADPKPIEKALKSCKKSLNFDLNEHGTDLNSVHMSNPGSCAQSKPEDKDITGNQPCNTMHPGLVEESTVQQMAKEVSRTVPDKSESFSGPNSSPCASSNEAEQIRGSKRGHSSITDATDSTAGNVAAYQSAFGHSSTVLLGNANIHGASGILFPGICKKKRTDNVQRSLALSAPAPAASDDINHASNTTSHSSNDASSLKYFYPNPVYFGGSAVAINRAAVLMRNVQSRMQLYNTWADLARLKKKKRSKGITRVRDLSELKGIASIAPATPAAKCPRGNKVDASGKPYSHGTSYINMSRSVHSCVEALTDDIHMTPRSKRGPRKQSSPRSFNKDKANRHWDLVLYDMKHPAKKNAGARSPGKMNVSRGSIRWISTCSVEAVTEGLKCLNINRECSEISRPEQSALVPYHVNDQAEKALVLYKQDGAIVPFEGPFEPIRKRRQRAKVELDDETTRVWRLLLENIDNQGIDGTDEEKVKWWENERSVFRGRVDSFIARMRLVQGDRRFTPWKGSVLDSVIGVFLTQNVSDHLSSSAFMALAAHFPVTSEHKESTLSEEAMSALVVEPEVCVIEPEESITWHDRVLDPPVCDQISRIVHDTDHSEEKEVVNSKELVGSATVSVIPSDDFCESSQKTTDDSRVDKPNSPTTGTEGASIIGDDRARDDETSSQQSVILSQNSVNSPNFQAIRIMSSFSDTNARAHDLASSSKCNYFDCSTSFMGLLKMAENPLLHESLSRIPGEDQQNCRAQASKDQSEAPSTSSSNYQLHRQIDFHSQASKYIEMLEAESRSSDTSRKDENSPIEQSNTESNGLHLEKEKALDGSPRSFYENLSSCYVLEGGKMVIQSQMQSVKGPLDTVASSAQGQTDSMLKRPNLPNLSQEPDVTESTTGFHTSNHQKEIDQVSTHNHISPRTLDKADPRPSKPKSRSGKEKRNAFDWDSLRRQAQPNGKKRERTSNTRDSIDWEAVRLAPVSEIADTIKARGMNNMLAERIKELLDRLLREHGSIDLEWLRDIPPDKAKEYLLSFRGLGLKSVECVRLLTLHHLAFPVDTNVGRIAVRLGWVPLQPLPESLQLHLLELYPVLESIQKYLWPRLCKLDQKTLYELHYHLITFGKVFCTKRQPNCNACPLRGECRHFASAFASARLALPGPDERSIMASNGGTSSNMHPLPNIDPLALPSIGENHQEGANPTCNINSSMIDVPPTPLSLPVPQTVNQFEKKLEINGCEPIVEVPASPEPEPEQEQTLCDIEDTLYEDPDDIPTITLNMKEFTQNLENFMQANSELQETGMSKALVALTSEAASIPMPKLKNISRLRTEHHVYELPDTHPLLKELDKREPDDPCSYLLAIWTPGETANSVEPPARKCSFEDPSILCNDATCSYCSSQRESNSQIVRATLLIPCRTAMRGSFPLNGTYFQVNEVFADHDSSIKPIEVPRSWLWNLPRRTVYFGTSIPTIFRGLNTEEIQHCFWRGYVCVRGFDQKTRAPRPLMARLHFPASKMQRGAKGKGYGDDE